jgi:hypothetical protein
MGRTVRFDQIFVTSLDAAPRETDVLSGLASIDAGEITADQIQVANLTITNKVTANVESTEFTGLTNVYRFTATQVGIGTDNPTNEFQLGSDSVIMNRNLQDLITIQGNTVSTNLFATNILKTTNDKFFVDANGSNVLEVTGNTTTTNASVATFLSVGSEVDPATDSNIAVFENGNVVVKNGVLRIFGNTEMVGNLSITEIPDYLQVNSLVLANAVIQMATDPTNTGPFSGNDGTYDMATLMVQKAGDANIFFGYTQSDDTMKLGRTLGGPLNQTFTIDPNTTTNLHVFGDIYTQNNIGIANTSPTLSFSVGSNVHMDDVADASGNVLYANGFGFFEGLRIGDSGLTVGSLITLDADAAIPMVVASKIQAHGIQTTGVDEGGNGIPSGIANTNSTNMLSIGDKIFINADSANLVTVLGNTATGRLITESILVQDFIEVEGESGISSAANVIIHGDINGEDSVSNTLSLRCGPQNIDGTLGSNTSAIEIKGAKTSAEFQTVLFKTKNTERMRVASSGNVGISNTEPDELLTLGGNLRVNGSNSLIAGTTTNYLKSYSDVTGTQTNIQSRVGTGKGLNFYASTTDTMGNPKMTILESSNVGIGTVTPKGLLHTSGGTVLVNGPIQYNNNFNTKGTPLVVSNTSSISNSTLDLANVMHLTREGTSVRDGVRATFKMGKYDLEVGKSRSKLDVFLSDDRYTSETEVLTLRADGRVGIGHTQPTAYLEVKCTGIANPETNGLLVHNHDNGDAIMAAQADSLEGNAFTSYILSDGANRSGWSLGVENNNDFRITQNYEQVVDSSAVAIYISDSDRNIGIGTDVPRGKLEVNGNVVIGNQLTFGGLETDEFGNTFIRERFYNTDGKTELLIYKGNEGALASVTGPDRIRSVAPVHIFQTYDDTGQTSAERETLLGSEAITQNALLTINKDRVLVGTSVDPGGNSRLFVDGGFQFATGSKVITGQMDLFSVTTGGNKGIIDNISSALTFRQNGVEYARFTEEGLFGLNTDTPSTNVHVYSALTTDIDVLKLESPGTNKKTGISLNTNDNYGGYVRGFSNTQHSVHGTVLGAVKNSVEVDGIHIIDSSNVGIGTVNPSTKFTVYNGTTRLEHATSNAILEFKTTGGVSNIYGDHTGNVFIDPVRSLVVKSDTEITGDLQIDGKIDLGNQVAIDLGGSDATTALHVGGGFISGSNEVGCKRYSKSFTLDAVAGKKVRLYFGDGGTPEKMPAFYAKIVAMLRKTDGSAVRDMSTMVLEIQGGSHDGTTNNNLDDNITVGTKNLFGGDTDFPWNPNITAGKRGIILTPHDVGSGRIYKYDIHVEIVSASLSGTHTGGFLKNIKNSQFFGTEVAQDSQVDTFGAGSSIVSFTY